MKIGYFLSCEEYTPHELIAQARLAEEAGFAALDLRPLPPLDDEQGHSPFVWSVIGALAEATSAAGRPRRSPARRCASTRRSSPRPRRPARCCSRAASRSAWAAARRSTSTSSATSGPRPTCAWRCSRRPSRSSARCGRAATQSHRGRHYTVENARLYTLPDAPPPILVSGFGPKAIELAGAIGDGFCDDLARCRIVERYRGGAAGPGPGRHEGLLGRDEAEARRTVHRLWPNEALPGELAQVLPTPRALRAGDRARDRGDDRRVGPVRARPRPPRRGAAGYADAGFDELYVQQIGGGTRRSSTPSSARSCRSSPAERARRAAHPRRLT